MTSLINCAHCGRCGLCLSSLSFCHFLSLFLSISLSHLFSSDQHECTRVFADRFVSEADCILFANLLNSKTEQWWAEALAERERELERTRGSLQGANGAKPAWFPLIGSNDAKRQSGEPLCLFTSFVEEPNCEIFRSVFWIIPSLGFLFFLQWTSVIPEHTFPFLPMLICVPFWKTSCIFMKPNILDLALCFLNKVCLLNSTCLGLSFFPHTPSISSLLVFHHLSFIPTFLSIVFHLPVSLSSVCLSVLTFSVWLLLLCVC